MRIFRRHPPSHPFFFQLREMKAHLFIQFTAKAPAAKENREFVQEPDERIHLSFLRGTHDSLDRRNHLFKLR